MMMMRLIGQINVMLMRRMMMSVDDDDEDDYSDSMGEVSPLWCLLLR